MTLLRWHARRSHSKSPAYGYRTMIGPFNPERGAAAFPMVAGRHESATGAASITNTTVTANPITCQLKNAARQINPIRTPRAMSAESLPTAPIGGSVRVNQGLLGCSQEVNGWRG
jgi:hypothetical protein